MKVSEIKKNPNNPRVIKDDKFQQLVKSIKDFPEMMELRPMVVNDEMVLLGGNMRLAAIQSLGMKEIPDSWVKKAADLTPEQQKEFVIKDNVGFGVWDWDDLANEWDVEKLEQWGLDVLIEDKIDQIEDGEEIELEQSVQLEPPMEYILIMADPNSVEWEEIKEKLKLKIVRKGGYKEGSAFDAVGLERVIEWKDFKKRYVDSDTK